MRPETIPDIQNVFSKGNCGLHWIGSGIVSLLWMLIHGALCVHLLTCCWSLARVVHNVANQKPLLVALHIPWLAGVYLDEVAKPRIFRRQGTYLFWCLANEDVTHVETKRFCDELFYRWYE